MYLHQRVGKNLENKLSLLTEIKETKNTLKTLASDNSSKEILIANTKLLGMKHF